ncbi:HNH endonuclease [Rhodococcus sp. PD04]|uniref:HNH endonuclease n=1 Tax=Rhodococcus sp. PD04 TaxID=3109594 RepID=UPI003FA3951F
MAKANPRYANGHRRRKLRERVLAEEDVCALCGLAVDKTLTNGPDGKPHPLRGEVDEIVPVSRGGSPFERANVQLAHRRCNQRKGNRMPGDRVRATRLPLPVSQQW